MEKQNLLIVFVKNIILGKVKTRLAKTIGNKGAFDIYSELVAITEKETQKLDVDRHIYFSDIVISSKWNGDLKFVQQGTDLGEKMQNALSNGFKKGYKNIIIIGSDLPNISVEIIERGFEMLGSKEVVIGPAEDGGYYLLGISKILPFIFEDKPWSESSLLELTLKQLSERELSVGVLKPLNDIDTFEDLMASDFYKTNTIAQNVVNELKSNTKL